MDNEGFDDYEIILSEEDDTENADIVLEFAEEDFDDFGEALLKANDALGLYSFEEILDLNDMPEDEAVALLFEAGMLGLPIEVNEEIPDNEDEEAEDQE